MRCLDQYFNDHFHYPVIIFHEVNFTKYLQEAVKKEIKSDIYFQLVEFRVPDFVRKPIPAQACLWSRPLGYRHMCRFQAKGVYDQPIIQNVQYAWRLDDDTFITNNITYDLFKFMSEHQMSYGYRVIIDETPTCILNLWENATLYVKNNNISTELFTHWPRNKVFLNNFEISDVNIWRSKKYEDYVNMVDHLGGIYHHRWGDAPIKTIALAMFVPRNKTHQFIDIGYKHQGTILYPGDVHEHKVH
jgi:hypothetical protein